MPLGAINTKLYGVAFLALAGFMYCGAVLFAVSSWEAYSSRNWPSVSGTVIQSHTEHTCGGYRELHSWEAKILYRYSVAGRQYEAARISIFKPFCDSEKENVQRWLEQNYPVGKAVDVYYDPVDPSAAFLHPGAVSKFELFMIAVLLTIGCLLVWGGRMSFRKSGVRYQTRGGMRF